MSQALPIEPGVAFVIPENVQHFAEGKFRVSFSHAEWNVPGTVPARVTVTDSPRQFTFRQFVPGAALYARQPAPDAPLNACAEQLFLVLGR